MNTKRARKYNTRRKFFNKGKGEQCPKCGSLYVSANSLDGSVHISQICPLGHNSF